MFKFRFASDTADSDEENSKEEEKLEWFPASRLQVTSEQIATKYEADCYTQTFPGCDLKLIHFDKVLRKLTEQKCQNIIEAESQHSDLIPAKYEGGLKIWECTFDLGQYILEEKIDLKDKLILDLGCGIGSIGLIALLRGASVHFQDYNAEVLQYATIPNVLSNLDDRADVSTRCEFYAGDWESFAALFDDDESKKYDCIFTSETIYNSSNHSKLYQVLKRRLKISGVVFVAGKTYYFGVGGGMRQFERLVLADGYFDIEPVWKNQDGGINKEILKFTRKTH